LSCTLGEIVAAVGAVCYGEDDAACSDEPDAGADYEQIVAALVAMSGVGPEVWRCRVSASYALRQIAACRKVADGGGPDTTREKIEAERAIGKLLIEIRDARKAGPGNG
jgi:hypothetical protein